MLITDGHALLDHAFHTTETNAKFILDQLTNSLRPSITQMVNIIRCLCTIINHDHPTHQTDDVPLGNHPVGDRYAVMQLEFLVTFIKSNAFKVVMTTVKHRL